MSELCTLLPWDSQYFGRRIARVNGKQIDAGLIQQASVWCTDHQIDCLYILADANDAATVVAAEKWGAHFSDIRVGLKSEVEGAMAESIQRRVRPFLPADLPVLREIARQSHEDSRFFFDPHFDRETCRSFYETWITRSCADYADAVLVAEMDGIAAGYVTCQLEKQGLPCSAPSPARGRIGLFAVGPRARGQGVGRELAGAALAWFAGHGVREVTVVTQGRNVKAQRLYAAWGFELDSVDLWYHKWFER